MKFLNHLAFCALLFFCVSSVSAQYPTKLIVAADGSGDFTSIQKAIDACKIFPDKPITVFIKNGTYHEKVTIPAGNQNLSLIGEDVEKTIIVYDDYFDRIGRGRNSTFYTYTLKAEANDSHFENLTISNSAGPVGQGVALHISGDRCTIKNCRILGHQDTLYTEGENSRQFFDNCYIEGTTDFIFGAATVLFSQCVIHSLSDSFITAASTPEWKPFGYVFMNCVLTASEGVKNVYLGRPWRNYAKVVFINCKLGSHILPEGWSNWDGTSNDQTAFYAEFNNVGPGANPKKRINRSHQLTSAVAKQYTFENIFAPVCPPFK